MEPKKTVLNVAEAQQDDVDKGTVRIDSEIMQKADIHQGDIVEIQGERRTVAIAARAFPADLGMSIIRMDPLARRNAGTSIGEKVNIHKIEAKYAKKIVLAPVKGHVIIRGDTSGIKQSILGRAVSKGDLVSLGGARRRRREFTGTSFEDIFAQMENMFGEDMGMGGFGFGGLKFVVVSTTPSESVIITEDTQVQLKTEPVELREEKIPEIAYVESRV